MNAPQAAEARKERTDHLIPTRALNPLLSPLPNPPLSLSRSITVSCISGTRQSKIHIEEPHCEDLA
jgi:hypothetical protein